MIGVIKWFDSVKGFGVIECSGDTDFFIHKSEMIDYTSEFREGTIVKFKERSNSSSSKKTAKNCCKVSKIDDWEDLMFYLDKNATVTLQIKVIRKGHRGNPYFSHEFKTINIIDEGVQNIILNNPIEDIFCIITEYFNNQLDNNLFINYCEAIESAIKKSINDKVISENLINRIFNHFGQNINQEILFTTWKSRNFKFLGYVEALDFQIPENLILQNIHEVGFKEFERIFNYEYEINFIINLIENKIEKSDINDFDEINELYRILEIPYKIELNNQKFKLDKAVFQRINYIISDISLKHKSICDYEDLSEIIAFKKLLPRSLNDDFKSHIILELEKLIINKSTNDFLIELWISGIINSIPNPNELTSYFFNKELSDDKRLKIFLKSTLDIKVELLKKYFELNDLEKTFELLIQYTQNINELSENDNYSNYISSNILWLNKNDFDCIAIFKQYVFETSNDSQKIELFFKGYIEYLPVELFLVKIDSFNFEEINHICLLSKYNQKELIQVFNALLTDKFYQDVGAILKLAKKVLNKSYFNKIDKKITSIVGESNHFAFWEMGISEIFPENYILLFLNHQNENFERIIEWDKKGLVSIEKISNLLLRNLKSVKSIQTRPQFQACLNQINWLINNGSEYLNQIIQIESGYFNLILWFLGKSEIFDFEFLKEKFILFLPIQEVIIIKKLFFLKVEGEFDLTISKLDSLFRIDLDLYDIGKEYNPNVDIDISSDILIKSLLSFSVNNKFLSERELLDLVLRNLKSNKSKRFKIEHYFESCQGRAKYEFDFKNYNGIIFKKYFNEDKDHYFAIRTNYSDDSDFIRIKDEIKLIPGAKWNPIEKHWGVPSKYEKEVFDFGVNCRFRFNTDVENTYLNNLHFAKILREDPPEGIIFCEGRLANKIHNKYKVPFWWCAGNVCIKHCETIHDKNEWQNYTLIDFLDILGYNTDEMNHMSDLVPKGNYYKFMGLINRFNKLLEKLYCQECDEILYPIQTSHFAANNYTTFCCENLNCDIRKKSIYLNRCVTNSCENIIDSRVSQRCPNGLVICNNCSSCCSHSNMKKRYQNLKLVGGYIHPELVNQIKHKLGHRERGAHFCYKCSSLMQEKSPEIFHCENCKKDFDLRKYKFDRTNKYTQNGELEEDSFFNDSDEMLN